MSLTEAISVAALRLDGVSLDVSVVFTSLSFIRSFNKCLTPGESFKLSGPCTPTQVVGTRTELSVKY